MHGIYLSAREIDALHGGGPLMVTLYVWMRTWMDLRTRRVGITRPISLAMLADYAETHITRGAGVQTLKPTVKEIRTALARAVSAGLLRRAGNDDCLVFSLPLAAALPLVQNEQGKVRAGSEGTEPGRCKTPEPGTEPDSAESSNGAGFGMEPGTEPGRPNETNLARNLTGVKHPNRAHIRDQRNTSTQQAAAKMLSGVDAANSVAARGSAEKVEEPCAGTPLDRRIADLAVACRQAGVGVAAHSKALLEWARKGVSPAQVLEAATVAQARRAEQSSTQPIGAGFLSAILGDIVEQQQRPPPWWSSVAAMDAQARALGVPLARPGEEMDAYRVRIKTALWRDAGSMTA